VQHPVSSDSSLLRGARLRVRSAQSFLLSESDGNLVSAPLCRASAVDGTVRKIMGDTVVLERAGGIVSAPDSDGVRRGCLTRDILAFTRTADMEVTERKTDKGKTTLLLVGIAAGLVALAAYGASQIQYDYPTGSGTLGW
jgi:class 3 adenylate cyclase